MWHKITVFHNNTSRGYILLNSLPAFAKGSLTVGSSRDCDIALPFKGVAENCGAITISGNQAFFTKHDPEGYPAPQELHNNGKLAIDVGVELVYTSFHTSYAPPQTETKPVRRERTGGFWQRVPAFLADAAIVTALVYLLGLIAGLAGRATMHIFRRFLYRAAITDDYSLWWWLLIALLYYAVFEASRLQATPGKLALRIKVADIKGKRINFGRALLRNICKFVSVLPLFFGFLTIYGDGAALHDKISGCRVVER